MKTYDTLRIFESYEPEVLVVSSYNFLVRSTKLQENCVSGGSRIGKIAKFWSSIASVLLYVFNVNFHQISLTITSFYRQSLVGVTLWWLLLSWKGPWKRSFRSLGTNRNSKYIFFRRSLRRAFQTKVLWQFTTEFG